MKHWQATVEWATTDTYSEDALDVLMDHLEGHDAAAGPNSLPATDPDGRDYWAAVVTVEANTLRQAIAAALELVEGATGEKATAVEVLPDDVAEARALAPSIPELVGYAEIAEMFGVTRQRARQLVDLPGFPAAVVETTAGPLRVRRQVEVWGQTWERKSGRPRKATADDRD
jgi:hypothetical protein